MNEQRTLRSWSLATSLYRAKGSPSLRRVAGQRPSDLGAPGLLTVLKSIEDSEESVFTWVVAVGSYREFSEYL